MRRLLRFVLPWIATLMGSLLVAAQGLPPKDAQQQQWKEYAYPNDGFAITLPHRADPHEDSTLSKATFTAFTVSGTQAYTVGLSADRPVTLHVATFPKGCSDFFGQYQSLIRGAKDGTIDTSKAGIQVDAATLREVTVGGYPAVENEHETKSQSRYYDRTQCVDKKLYIFTVTWPAGSTKPSELSRIINSFRLLTK
jgi:hypothetical protein